MKRIDFQVEGEPNGKVPHIDLGFSEPISSCFFRMSLTDALRIADELRRKVGFVKALRAAKTQEERTALVNAEYKSETP